MAHNFEIFFIKKKTIYMKKSLNIFKNPFEEFEHKFFISLLFLFLFK